jgi:TRAP-type C4-dicarboxylate transport system permease small subunit
MKIIKWIDEYLEEVLMVLLLIGIVVVMGAQVVARYLFNNSLSWSDELTKYMLVWSAFLSVSYCIKKHISIKITQFQDMLPPRAVPWIKMLRHTIVFIFCILMIPYCVTYVQQAISSGATSSAMKLPLYYIQAAPLVGFLLLTVRVAQAWVRECKASWKGMKEDLVAQVIGEMKKEQAEREEKNQ